MERRVGRSTQGKLLSTQACPAHCTPIRGFARRSVRTESAGVFATEPCLVGPHAVHAKIRAVLIGIRIIAATLGLAHVAVKGLPPVTRSVRKWASRPFVDSLRGFA